MDRSVWRILDANFNRAAEALRVMEEHARMILDDAALTRRLKTLRHQLAQCAVTIGVNDLLAARDTGGDVGTAISTRTERVRSDAPSVARAAAKRAAEALRSIEEYAKIEFPQIAVRVEALRYGTYSAEQGLFIGGPRRCRLHSARLHVLVTAALCRGDWLRVCEAAIRGGTDVLQLREKELSDREWLRRAGTLRDLTRRHDVLLIVNDRPDIAVLADADGVHVGRADLSAADARRIVGPHRLVGASTHSEAEAMEALAHQPDYLGVGPMFASQTKPAIEVQGLSVLARVAKCARRSGHDLPLVAIGGIGPDNAGLLPESISGLNANAGPDDPTGVRPILLQAAVCQSVISADDPEAAAARIRAALENRSG